VHSTAQQFGLDLRVYEGSFVKGLQRCMAEMEAETVGTTVGTAVGQQQKRRTGPLAFGFVLGTRRGDPNCGVQTAFTPSSDWMPPFMRVNPILDWEYGQVNWTCCCVSMCYRHVAVLLKCVCDSYVWLSSRHQ
jgi:hypothetical protein